MAKACTGIANKAHYRTTLGPDTAKKKTVTATMFFGTAEITNLECQQQLVHCAFCGVEPQAAGVIGRV